MAVVFHTNLDIVGTGVRVAIRGKHSLDGVFIWYDKDNHFIRGSHFIRILATLYFAYARSYPGTVRASALHQEYLH
jgi:hypothetical protein